MLGANLLAQAFVNHGADLRRFIELGSIDNRNRLRAKSVAYGEIYARRNKDGGQEPKPAFHPLTVSPLPHGGQCFVSCGDIVRGWTHSHSQTDLIPKDRYL